MPKRISTQRDKMRGLYREYEGDKEETCAAYVRAEKDGEVKRKSNKNRMRPEDYASRLWKDGVRRGWLSE